MEDVRQQGTAADAEVVQQKVQECVAQVIGKEVLPGQPLMEAGLDSLSAVELRTALAAAFDSDLPATVVFDYPTVSALSAFITSQHSGAPFSSSYSPLQLYIFSPAVLRILSCSSTYSPLQFYVF